MNKLISSLLVKRNRVENHFIQSSFIKNFITSWNRFWFKPIDLYGVGLFRMLLGFVLFLMYSIRFQNIELFYFNTGLLPAEGVKDLLPQHLISPYPIYFITDTLNYWGHFIFIVLLMFFALGLIGRWGTWILFFLSLSFQQRNFPLVYGADLFVHFWLFSLCFIEHNRFWTIQPLFKRRIKKSIILPKTFSLLPQVSSDIFSSAFTRMIQIQLALAYAYTGVEKFKGHQWWEGSALWYVLGMKDLVSLDLTALRDFPVLIALLSMLTIIFEVYFIFAVYNKHLRPYWLMIGLGMHFGIALLMSLPFFSLIMVLPYLLFIDPQTLRQKVIFFRKLNQIVSFVVNYLLTSSKKSI